MTADILIQQAHTKDAPAIAVLVGELLVEIMNAIDTRAFNFNLQETTARLEAYLANGTYVVFVARPANGDPVGFVALCECHALYAEGAFGTIPELYVRPAYRTRRLGMRLVSEAKAYGTARGWKRLEVTTPPLPQFDRTLAFYVREGFSVAGGRKLRTLL
ncbi:GNAT family N-acetyltransferase [Thiobacillus sp.]|uniref:GNAT family N-acetyltransferase n=1 Tax=Thiobacillus sp. TaxID=924 RepID=UPI0011DA03DC|nr:GNAT family N-acetyltransferase [Thiobacillus sp.]TXH73589.1 MAG: N-acetyltransferase [Thiobacillus sp.]